MAHVSSSTKITILGCGSSGGVPRPGSGWGACDPSNARNRRRRCSILVERIGSHGNTSVLIDTSPDLREQLISADVQHLDAVMYTHDHADHTHGVDDLRPLAQHMRKLIDVHADAATSSTLLSRFGYIFETPIGSDYPPVAQLLRLQAEHAVTIEGAGGTLVFHPFSVEHGRNYEALGFRFGNTAYVPDVSKLPESAMAILRGLDLLILDALRFKTHPTHFSVAESLDVIAHLKPRHAVLTNLHTDVDYMSLSRDLPDHIELAYDGMALVSAT